MGLLTITVPPGLRAGDEMAVEAPDGNVYNILVPDGVSAGAAIDVDLPGGDEDSGGVATGTQPVELVVPDGVTAGTMFTVEFNGTNYDIACPDGCRPGDAIVVELPADDATTAPPPTEPGDDDDDDLPAPDLPDNSHFKYKPGQRVELIRAGRGDDEVTSSGTIVSGFEGVFEVCYKVKLDNGLYKEAVPEDEISDKVTSDMGDLFGDW